MLSIPFSRRYVQYKGLMYRSLKSSLLWQEKVFLNGKKDLCSYTKILYFFNKKYIPFDY